MKKLFFSSLLLILSVIAFGQVKKEVTLSETFGQCVNPGTRIPTKKSTCSFTENSIFEEYAINDSVAYSLKIAVVPKDKPVTLNGFPEGCFFLEPHDKIFYRYNQKRVVPCDLDKSFYLVVFPWNTSLETVLEQQKKYNRKGCTSEIVQSTKAGFEIAVKGRSRKK